MRPGRIPNAPQANPIGPSRRDWAPEKVPPPVTLSILRKIYKCIYQIGSIFCALNDGELCFT
jgi:hypothetical protein